MTKTLERRIMRHEGFSPSPRPDAKGMWEIGYGHDITPEQATGAYANGITEDQALTMLDSDIATARAQMLANFPWMTELDDLKQGIITEMIFQLGLEGLFGFKNFLFCARSGDDAGAAREMLDSDWHRQTPARCEELADLWRNPPELTS